MDPSKPLPPPRLRTTASLSKSLISCSATLGVVLPAVNLIKPGFLNTKTLLAYLPACKNTLKKLTSHTNPSFSRLTSSFLKETQWTPQTLNRWLQRNCNTILERPLDPKGERIAELARRSIWHRAVRSQGRRDQVPTAAAAKHGGQPRRGTGRGGGGER